MSFKQLVSWIFVLLCPGYSWLFLPSASVVFAGRIETNESYYYVGETITLHCYAEKEFVDATFTYLNRTVVPTQYVTLINNTYARMEKVAEATDPDRTSYDCWLDFNKTIAVASQVIETEYRPQHVTNMTCIYYNKVNVFCTWDIGVQYKYAKDVNVDPEWSSNPDVPNYWRECSSSTKTTCTINYYYNIFLSIRVNVTNRRRHDTAVLQHDINDVYTIFKTDPVQNLHIESVTSTCVSLSWKLLYSDMIFIVQYSVTGSQNYSQMITESQSTNICNLRPNSLYTFIVKTRPGENGYFSDPSVIDVQTKEDVKNDNRGISFAINVKHFKDDYRFSFIANATSERSIVIFTSPGVSESSTSGIFILTLICTLVLFIIIVATVIYLKREKLISLVMKKRNNSQIAINSGTGEHETSDIHPLGDNASRVYSEIRESFLDVQNQDIDYLSIINEPIDDQLNHSQAIYYEIPENQSAIGGHLTSGKQDCLHVFFDTSQDTGADKRSYLHPIQLSQIDDDKLDYLHLHHESNSDEERPVYQQLSHYLNSSHEILHTTEMSGTGGDRLDYSSLHLESNSDEERPVYQQLSHDLNSGHEILHTTEMSGTGGDRLDYSSLHYKSNSDKERPIYQQLSHDLNNGCEERVVLHPAYVSLNQLRPAILNVTYVSHNEIGNLGNQCPTDVKHNEQDEI